jgi:TolB-like protein
MIAHDDRNGAGLLQDSIQAMADSSDARDADKKKSKVRAVWISFAGRIVAQVFGAIASIVLGVMFLHKYQQNAQPVARTQAAVVRTANRAAGGTAIAVLPLESYSSDARDAYLADGMTEAIIADLAQVEGLRVISRTSTMSYKRAGRTLPDIARELDVDLIVEGSVVRSGDRMRVTAQLIDAVSDEHLWARSYDRSLVDVLGVQADVAAAIGRDVAARTARED